jgi:hypothetical protein
MGLGKRKTGGGEPLAKLVWDSKGGKIYIEVRTNNGRGWWSEQTPIELGEFRGTPDLPNLEVGWIAYLKGIGLDAKLVRVRGGEDYGGCPSGDHHEGLRLVWSVGGTAHEMISTAAPVWDATDTLDAEFLAGAGEHPGSLPIVGIAESTAITLKNGDVVYAPVFKILDWRLRPPELPPAGIPLFRRAAKKRDDDFGNNTSTRSQSKADLDDEIPF